MTDLLGRIGRALDSVKGAFECNCPLPSAPLEEHGGWCRLRLAPKMDDARAALAELRAQEAARMAQEPVAWEANLVWKSGRESGWAKISKETYDECFNCDQPEWGNVKVRALYARPVSAGVSAPAWSPELAAATEAAAVKWFAENPGQKGGEALRRVIVEAAWGMGNGR